MKYLLHLLIPCMLVASAASMRADSGGKIGSFAAGCGGCHGGAASQATSVVLEGPRTIRAGQQGNYTFVVGHANPANQDAGFNLSFRDGGATAGTLTASNGSQVLNGELTHTAPKAMANNTARFDFKWTAPAQHGIYQFNGAGNAVNLDGIATGADFWNVTGNINITVSGANFTSPSAAVSLCRGQVLNLAWDQTGLDQVRLEWSSNNFATTDVIATSIAASTEALAYTIPATQAAGTYLVRMVDPATGGEIARLMPSVTVIAGPRIVLEPEPTLVCEGKALTLTVGADGTDLQYRWRRNGVEIPGGTKPVLEIKKLAAQDGGVYDCIVYGCGGNATTKSVLVTVGSAPVVTTQPVAQSACEGETVSFSMDATGNEITFQWMKNGEPIPNATTKQLVLSKITLFDESTYSCVVEGACTPVATTNSVKLNIVERPQIRTQPVDRSYRVGDTLMLTFEVFGEELTYQWFRGGVAVSGATDRLFRKLPVTKADSGTWVCKVMNRCDTIETRLVSVVVTSNGGPGKLVLTSTGLSLPSVPACAMIDTTIADLLVNEGGAPVTITSVSADPASTVVLKGFVTPLILEPNARYAVALSITPRTVGPFSATVTFFTSVGSSTFTINGESVPSVQFAKDTIRYTRGVTGEQLCNVTLPLACPETVINRVRLTGLGSSTYTLRPLDTPLPSTLSRNAIVNVCIESNAPDGPDAVLSVETAHGTAQYVVTRNPVTSVEDDEQVIAGNIALRIVPNPMTDELRITSTNPSTMNVRIVDVTGTTVTTLRGQSEIVWDRRNRGGAMVPSGLYVVIIDHNNQQRVEKVLVR
jgi:hypothetical protein